MTNSPKVSVIIPCRNEEKSIGEVLQAIYDQSYPVGDIEVLIADGMSDDKTQEIIADFSKEHSDLYIKVIDNEALIIPAALNLCLKKAKGEFIVRMDAHSIPNQEYIEISIRDLETGKGLNVGGVWNISSINDNWFSQGIAAAMENPFGIGDAKYRYGEKAEQVETVPFGAFKKSLIEEIGYFDEALLTNEDYEFNHRIRLSGGKIWLNPEISSNYFARPNLKEVWKQYWRYGYWKMKMLKRYPESLRVRQIVAPMFVLSLILLIVGSLIWYQARWIFMLEVVSYWVMLMVAGTKSAMKYMQVLHLVSVPITIITLHISWGSAFLFSFFESIVFGKEKNEKKTTRPN